MYMLHGSYIFAELPLFTTYYLATRHVTSRHVKQTNFQHQFKSNQELRMSYTDFAEPEGWEEMGIHFSFD